MNRAGVLTEARSWLGTRWQHQASCKGVATDCIGLVRGVAVNCKLVPPNFWESAAREFNGYSHQPSAALLETGLAKFAIHIPVSEAQPADVFLMTFGGAPQHVGFFGDYLYGGLSIIHAYAQSRMVVESRMDEVWREKIVAAYRLPGVE